MDPNATLAELRTLVARVDAEGWVSEDVYGRIAELFLALDGWLSAGGFLPAAWTPAGRER